MPEVFDLGGIERIADMFQRSDMESFEVEIQGARLKMSKNSPSRQAAFDVLVSALGAVADARSAVAPVSPFSAFSPASSETSTALDSVSAARHSDSAKDPTDDSSAVRVTSPLVGIYYAASSPDDAPFVHVGDRVRKGQTLCIVEAMKVMNEIPSPCDGTVRAVVPENGAVVAFGDDLISLGA